MTEQERHAIASIALLAAYADGDNIDAERDEVQRVAEALEGELPMASLHRDVLLGRTTVESASAVLTTRELKLLAYEFAVGVAESDGLRNEAESAFLAKLSQALGLDEGMTEPVHAQADSMATMPLQAGANDVAIDPEDQAAAEVASGKIFIGTAESSSKPVSESAAAAAAAGVRGTPAATSASRSEVDEIDQRILSAAIMNGALELLPQSLASMAIIPLQMKLVYDIGTRFGYELDRGHVKDLLATMGAGVTGQYLESIGRKLLGGVFGKAVGGMVGGLAKGATGMAFSFSTTWAIGQVARRYYAGGRTMDAELLKETFAAMMDEAKALQSRHAPQIAQQAKSIDTGKLLELVRSR